MRKTFAPPFRRAPSESSRVSLRAHAQFAVFVEGSTGFNFDFVATTSQFTFNREKELLRSDSCVGPIVLAGFFTLRLNCVLKTQVQGSVAFQGMFTASSSFSGTRELGIRYDGSHWTSLNSATWYYNPPSTTYQIQEGVFDVGLILKPTLEISLTVGYSALSMSATASIALEPGIALEVDLASLGRRLQPAWTDTGEPSRAGVAPIELAPGRSSTLPAPSSPAPQDLIVIVKGDCWQDMQLPIAEVQLAPYETTASVRFPWHTLLSHSTCTKVQVVQVRVGEQG